MEEDKKRKRAYQSSEDTEDKRRRLLNTFSTPAICDFELAQKPSSFFDRSQRCKQGKDFVPPREQTRCIVCTENIGLLTKESRENHVNECLRASGKYICTVCGKNITKFNEVRRQQHLNRCLDQFEKEKEVKIALEEPEVEVDSGFFADSWSCPICNKNLTTTSVTSRTNHMRKCAEKNNVTPKSLQKRQGPTKLANTKKRTTTVLDIPSLFKKQQEKQNGATRGKRKPTPARIKTSNQTENSTESDFEVKIVPRSSIARGANKPPSRSRGPGVTRANLDPALGFLSSTQEEDIAMAMAISLSEQDQQRDAEPEPKDDVGGFLSQASPDSVELYTPIFNTSTVAQKYKRRSVLEVGGESSKEEIPREFDLWEMQEQLPSQLPLFIENGACTLESGEGENLRVTADDIAKIDDLLDAFDTTDTQAPEAVGETDLTAKKAGNYPDPPKKRPFLCMESDPESEESRSLSDILTPTISPVATPDRDTFASPELGVSNTQKKWIISKQEEELHSLLDFDKDTEEASEQSNAEGDGLLDILSQATPKENEYTEKDLSHQDPIFRHKKRRGMLEEIEIKTTDKKLGGWDTTVEQFLSDSKKGADEAKEIETEIKKKDMAKETSAQKRTNQFDEEAAEIRKIEEEFRREREKRRKEKDEKIKKIEEEYLIEIGRLAERKEASLQEVKEQFAQLGSKQYTRDEEPSTSGFSKTQTQTEASTDLTQTHTRSQKSRIQPVAKTAQTNEETLNYDKMSKEELKKLGTTYGLRFTSKKAMAAQLNQIQDLKASQDAFQGSYLQQGRYKPNYATMFRPNANKLPAVLLLPQDNDEDKAQEAVTQRRQLFSEITRSIKSPKNKAFYKNILEYKSVSVSELKELLKEDNVKCSVAALKEYLKEQGVPFT